MQGAQGVAEGVPAKLADMMLDKFDRRPTALLIVRAGGPAGLFSAIIGGWPGSVVRDECQAVTKEIHGHENCVILRPRPRPPGAPASRRRRRSTARSWR